MGTRTAVITFFSGTGNTRHACGLLAEALERSGWRVRLREIAPPRREVEADRRDAAPPDLAVFAYPVFAFRVPHIVRRFIRRLPKVHRTPAAVLAVFGDDFTGPPSARRHRAGFEGGALDAVARMLGRRGYVARAAHVVGFPHSFTQFAPPPGEEECRLILADAEEAIASVAADLDAGCRERRGRGFATRAWTGVVGGFFSLVGRRVLGKTYIADDRCTSCGWCERACPAGTIRMRGRAGHRRLPRWGWQCEACQRCINGCPEQAIQVSVFRLAGIAVAVLPWGLLAARRWFHFPGAWLVGWCAGTFALTAATDLALRLLERVPAMRRVIGWSATRGFRRYRDPSATRS